MDSFFIIFIILLDSTKISKTRQVLDFDDDVKEVVKHSTRGRTHTDPIRARSPPEVSLGKRRSAAEAVDKIANTSKRLRGDSNDGKRIAYRK